MARKSSLQNQKKLKLPLFPYGCIPKRLSISYMDVLPEGLRNEIRQVAEGHQILPDGQARIIERLEQVEALRN